ncbi:MAG: hypothetical protein AAF270_00695 [Pseudomonadota bacterium]
MKSDSLQQTSIIPDDAARNVANRIWLPSFVYECVPYFYILAGFAALFATLYINAWYWVVPHWILFTALCLHFGFRILFQRYRYRRQAEDVSDS